MVKILHAADFHLDSPFAGLTSEQARARRREGRENIARLANYANAGHVDLVLLAGDLFDSGEIYRGRTGVYRSRQSRLLGRKRALRAGELAGERPYF